MRFGPRRRNRRLAPRTSPRLIQPRPSYSFLSRLVPLISSRWMLAGRVPDSAGPVQPVVWGPTRPGAGGKYMNTRPLPFRAQRQPRLFRAEASPDFRAQIRNASLVPSPIGRTAGQISDIHNRYLQHILDIHCGCEYQRTQIPQWIIGFQLGV